MDTKRHTPLTDEQLRDLSLNSILEEIESDVPVVADVDTVVRQMVMPAFYEVTTQGTIKHPSQVVLVSIDKETAKRLDGGEEVDGAFLQGRIVTATMSDLQQQLDELKANIDREVTRRVKNTLNSNADLKIEVRNLRAELTDLRASNKAVTGECDKLHGELVEVRSALADVSAERDSLRTTLASWEAADTAPFLKVPDVADHVMPPVLPLCMRCHECGRGLVSCSQGTKHHDCPSNNCPRTCTVRPGGFSPYSGPCKSDHPVRHE